MRDISRQRGLYVGRGRLRKISTGRQQDKRAQIEDEMHAMLCSVSSNSHSNDLSYLFYGPIYSSLIDDAYVTSPLEGLAFAISEVF
jgi:hypothetical protein